MSLVPSVGGNVEWDRCPSAILAANHGSVRIHLGWQSCPWPHTQAHWMKEGMEVIRHMEHSFNCSTDVVGRDVWEWPYTTAGGGVPPPPWTRPPPPPHQTKVTIVGKNET